MSPLICSFQLNDTAISLTRQASVHNVDFWQEKKKSTIAVLSCQSPGSLHEACLSCVCVVCLSPYRRLAQCSQDRTHPSLSTPVASVHGFPLRTRDSQPFWHAAMLASMQKKKTKSIRLIGASIFLFFFLGGGAIQALVCQMKISRWTLPDMALSRMMALRDEGREQMGPVPNTRSVIVPHIFLAHLLTKWTENKCIAKPRQKGRIWQPSKMIITAGSLKGHHMKPWCPRDLALCYEKLMRCQDVTVEDLWNHQCKYDLWWKVSGYLKLIEETPSLFLARFGSTQHTDETIKQSLTHESVTLCSMTFCRLEFLIFRSLEFQPHTCHYFHECICHCRSRWQLQRHRL